MYFLMQYIFLIFVIFSLIISYLFNTLLHILKLQNLKKELPPGFEDFYSEEESKKIALYVKKNLWIGFFERTFFFIATLAFILLNGFFFLTTLLEFFNASLLIKSILLFVILFLLIFFSKIPFNMYRTFFIEKKFNLTDITLKTYFADISKTLLVSFVVGMPLLLAVLWIIISFEEYNWLIIFATILVWQTFITFIAPVVIMPFFNTFKPLEESSLKKEIEKYCKQHKFSLKGVFVTDGSLRSKKANAFLTGFGKFKRIVLFDTLFTQMNHREIMAILAHEMGHLRLKHIIKQQLLFFLQTFLTLFVFHQCLNSTAFFDNFSIFYESVPFAIPLFLLFFAPFFSLFSLISLHFSRKYEYEADRYSLETYPHKNALSQALKKLSHNHMSPLIHHKLSVFFQHSHPPILERIKKNREYERTLQS